MYFLCLSKRFFGTNCKWGKKGGSVWYAFFEVLSITRINLGVLKTRSNLDHLLNMDGGPTPLYLQHCISTAGHLVKVQGLLRSKTLKMCEVCHLATVFKSET